MAIPFLAIVSIAIVFLDWPLGLSYLLILISFQLYEFTPDTFWLLAYVDLLPIVFVTLALFRRLVNYER